MNLDTKPLPTPSFPNTVIRASAGSGKTYQLSQRFLQLLFAGEPMDSILASTFTCKAAGEILRRILGRLAEAALDDTKCQDLVKELFPEQREETGHCDGVPSPFPAAMNTPILPRLQDTITRDTVQTILKKVVQSLHRLQVGTLDSFFIKLANSFALELKIPTGWKIIEVTDERRLLITAIRNVFNRTRATESSQSDARRLMNWLFKGEVRRDVTDQTVSLATELLSVVREVPYTDTSTGATGSNVWTGFRQHPQVAAQLNRLLSEEKMAAAIERYQNAPLPLTKKDKPHGTAVKSHIKDLEKLRHADWNGLLDSGLVSAVANGKTTSSGCEIPAELVAAATPIVAHIKSLQFRQIVNQTEATGELLQRIAVEFETLKRTHCALRFDDITFKLDNPQLLQQLEMVMHRLDASTRHLLLDEFQDTSTIQWHVLQPFAKQATGQKTDGSPADNTAEFSDSIRHDTTGGTLAGSFFCVGDMKQAIYAWRGGVAEIFDTVTTEIARLRQQKLAVSYRSSPIVMETVNQVFENIGRNLTLSQDTETAESPYLAAAKKWQSYFQTHKAAPKNDSMPGYCSLEVAPSPEDMEAMMPNELAEWNRKYPLPNMEDTDSENNDNDNEDDESGDGGGDDKKSPAFKQKYLTLQYTVSRVVELHKTKPDATIGVLVRRNELVGQLIYSLKKAGIEASEEGGNPLTDSPAVELLLSALTLADHPGNTVVRFHLAASPMAEVIGLTDFRDEVQSQTAAAMIRQQIFDTGIGKLVKHWVDELQPYCNERDTMRLNQFLKLAFQYQSQMTSRTGPFIEWLRETGVQNMSAAKVRVMTVHQSKGLEFDIVVLPELDQPLTGKSPKLVVFRETATGPITRLLRYVGKDMQKLLPQEYQQIFAREDAIKVEESLCLLYVAMTRAIHQLTMIVPPVVVPKTPSKTIPKRFDFVLRSELLNNPKDTTSHSVVYEHGNSLWSTSSANEGTASMDTSRDGDRETPLLFRLASVQPEHRRNWRRVSPSMMRETAADGTNFPPSLRRSTAFIPAVMTLQPPTNASGSPPFYLPSTPHSTLHTPLSHLDSLLRGTMFHACFDIGLRNIEWLDQGQIDVPSLTAELTKQFRYHPKNVAATVAADSPTKNTDHIIQTVVSTFLQLCQSPVVKQTLSLDSYQQEGPTAIHRTPAVTNPRWETFLERPFMIRYEDSLMTGSIDRLTLLYDGNRLVGADILDYKTDISPSEETFRHYGVQLEAYRQAVCQLYRLPSTAVTKRLLFTSLGQTVIV